MILQPNFILIEPHAHHTAGASHGMEIPDFANEHMNYAVTGTVLQVCDRLLYYGMEIKRLKSKQIRTIYDHRKVQEYLEASLLFDVPMELKIGDTVVYPYLYRTEDDKFDEERFEGNLVLKYDTLTAKVVDGVLKPLNGLLLGRKVKKDQELQQLRRDAWDGLIEVTHEGCLVRDYQEYGYSDRPYELLGKQVYITPQMAVSIEVPQQLRLADEQLFSFHRRHIVGINH